MIVDIDELIRLLLALTEKEIDFSSERQERIYERVFRKKEADNIEQV